MWYLQRSEFIILYSFDFLEQTYIVLFLKKKQMLYIIAVIPYLWIKLQKLKQFCLPFYNA